MPKCAVTISNYHLINPCVRGVTNQWKIHYRYYIVSFVESEFPFTFIKQNSFIAKWTNFQHLHCLCFQKTNQKILKILHHRPRKRLIGIFRRPRCHIRFPLVSYALKPIQFVNVVVTGLVVRVQLFYTALTSPSIQRNPWTAVDNDRKSFRLDKGNHGDASPLFREKLAKTKRVPDTLYVFIGSDAIVLRCVPSAFALLCVFSVQLCNYITVMLLWPLLYKLVVSSRNRLMKRVGLLFIHFEKSIFFHEYNRVDVY